MMAKSSSKAFFVFTPINPTRPFYERLNILHKRNVDQNFRSSYNYYEKEVVLPPSQQCKPQLRGVNVCREFNEAVRKHAKTAKYICKWDDDIILPPNILNSCRSILEDDPDIIGCGLFQEDYGAPNILMTNKLEDGFYGAFSRFYVYRADVWGQIPINEMRGDPDNAFQIGLQGKKHILNISSIHLNHRCFTDQQYKVLLDMATFFTFG